MKQIFGISLLERSRGAQPGNQNAKGPHKVKSVVSAVSINRDATGHVISTMFSRSKNSKISGGGGVYDQRHRTYTKPTKSSQSRLSTVLGHARVAGKIKGVTVPKNDRGYHAIYTKNDGY